MTITNTIVYEIHNNFNDAGFPHYSISEIKVLFNYKYPNSEKEFISYQDSDGDVWEGNLTDFYKTEKEATQAIKDRLLSDIVYFNKEIAPFIKKKEEAEKNLRELNDPF